MVGARIARAIGTAVVFSAFALPAHAVLPDEIQVYTGDINAPGEFGLELHVNTTPSGIGTPSYPGEVTTPHGWRATAEFSYGLTPSLELGLYVPTTLTRENTFYVTGPKVRVKWMPVRPVDGVGNFAGINVELAHVAGRFEASQNAAELRPIYGYQDDRWLWAVNPVLDWNLSGDGRSGVPEAAPSFKIARTVATGVRAGTEYYAGLGPINHIAPLHEQQHTVFLAFDVDRKPFVFNFGIGRGLTRASDRWTLKWIFEIPLS
ncbi:MULTISPECIES: hypothetical protein [Ralstonia]|uniref:MetA-pathway of phenol degradation n=1 Tax=Ralstonia pickettii OR214 TaxID=1264675 RepID=R0CRU8_RALPI|nr:MULTISPECIES: hypothetical protein [Ralstonia]MEA3271121.1 hypothetical protein [Pseudomonadota bacterium]ENZ79286.1 hypothetical protein OR214_00858 [Ralstonia pickettii OR214]MBL4777272.1 hypothetical protein [Ralstonia sp.]MCM3580444.1 hypothetical protein [Ralstonia pickettii]MDR9385486.1 hypothetical protein [Ralstonia sp. 11b]